MPTDMTATVSTLQAQNTILARLEQTVGAGILNLPYDAQYTVAGLPVTAAIGTRAYATNGRKPGEGGGAGTGVPVWFDISGVWFSYPSGAAVAA